MLPKLGPLPINIGAHSPTFSPVFVARRGRRGEIPRFRRIGTRAQPDGRLHILRRSRSPVRRSG